MQLPLSLYVVIVFVQRKIHVPFFLKKKSPLCILFVCSVGRQGGQNCIMPPPLSLSLSTPYAASQSRACKSVFLRMANSDRSTMFLC
jgi:hypothetical protein